MTKDASKPPKQQPQSTPNIPEGVIAEAREEARLAREVIGAPAVEIDRARSAQLPPPHTPSDRSEGDQAGGAARARHPAEERPLPSPSEIARNPKAYLPPTPTHGRDTGRGR